MRPPAEQPASSAVIRKKITPRRPRAFSTGPPVESAALAAYGTQNPTQWGETVDGIRTRLDTTEPVIALTFDACGGPKGSRYDSALIDYLRKEKIPATLFISGSWADANPAVFKKLASDPLFEIANHGLSHKPCSVNGKAPRGSRARKASRACR